MIAYNQTLIEYIHIFLYKNLYSLILLLQNIQLNYITFISSKYFRTFFLKTCITFFTGILQTDNSEQVILEPKLIARNYLRSWFFLDLISSLPLDYLFLMFNQVTNYKI